MLAPVSGSIVLPTAQDNANMRDVLLAMRADAVARSHNNWRASFGEPSPVRPARLPCLLPVHPASVHCLRCEVHITTLT